MFATVCIVCYRIWKIRDWPLCIHRRQFGFNFPQQKSLPIEHFRFSQQFSLTYFPFTFPCPIAYFFMLRTKIDIIYYWQFGWTERFSSTQWSGAILLNRLTWKKYVIDLISMITKLSTKFRNIFSIENVSSRRMRAMYQLLLKFIWFSRLALD